MDTSNALLRHASPTPAFPTRFVGRAEELARIAASFDGGARLVTITGPPGMGKTRLACEYAERLFEHEPPGGIWFVDLTAARDLEALCSGVASELGVVSGRDGGLVARVGHALRARDDTLVILDNFEQLLSADEPVHALATWLAQTSARFLVTSREILRLRGEHVCELGPLAIPVPGETTRENALTSSALALLLERAPSLSVTDDNAQMLAQIAAALEGIPLALELCASRLLTLGPAAVLERMPARLDLLARGERDAHARQRTLRSAFDWSWELLEPEERAALAGASVFERGFEAAAFEAVCGEGSPRALELLQSLREKSLVRATITPGAAELRFGLYESTRAYAGERLAALDAEGGARTRHARFFAEAGYHRARAASGAESAQAIAWLSRELDNLLAAAEFRQNASARAGVEERARLLLAAEPVFIVRGPLERYERLLEGACTEAALVELEPELASRLLEAQARLLRQAGRMPESLRALDAALEHARVTRDGERECELLSLRAEVELERGQFQEARGAYDAALALLPERADARLRARAHGGLGLVHHSQGRLDEAQRAYQHALEYAERTSDRRLQAGLYKDLGSLRLQQGRLDEAEELYDRARALLEALADPLLVGAVEGNLAILAQERGDYARSAELFASSEQRLSRHGARLLAAHVRGYAGGLAHERGELERASRSYEEASSVLREFGDRRNDGLFTAMLGAAQAARGRRAAAEEAFAAAERLLHEVGDPGLLEALELYRAHLRLLVARTGRARPGEPDDSQLRRELAELVRARRGAWASSPEQPSDDARLALRLLERALTSDAWSFDFETGELKTPSGQSLDLKNRAQLLRIVRALVAARLNAPGVPVSQDELVEAGWPGERMKPEAAANRVKVALSTLRSAGLRALLLRHEGGHFLDPDVPVVARGVAAQAQTDARKR